MAEIEDLKERVKALEELGGILLEQNKEYRDILERLVKLKPMPKLTRVEPI